MHRVLVPKKITLFTLITLFCGAADRPDFFGTVWGTTFSMCDGLIGLTPECDT